MKKNNNFSNVIKFMFAGFAMGVANVIPGVSGGTMAFILGVFERLINAISTIASVDTLKLLLKFQIKAVLKRVDWNFLIPLTIGVLIAFAGVTKLFLYLLENHTSETYAFFFGLIIASILTVYKKINKLDFKGIISFCVGAVAAYLLISLIPMSTPNVWYITFLCGIIVICAMILPGISGSFLLLILGQYSYVWGAVGDFISGKFSMSSLITIFSLALGAIIGLCSFVHILKYLFKRFHDVTVCLLIGFMVGSIPRLWPWQEVVSFSVKTGKSITNVRGGETAMEAVKLLDRNSQITILEVRNFIPKEFNSNFWIIIGLMIVGLILVILTELIATKKENVEEV